MHRNVTRHLPRQYRLRALPATCQLHRYPRAFSSIVCPPNAATEDAQVDEETSTDPEPTPPLQTYNDEETKRILQALDQRSLLDNKIKLNSIIPKYEALRTSIPALFSSTIPAQPEPLSKPKAATATSASHYTLGLERHRLNDLPKHIDAVLARTKHMRAHIQDLQSADYVVKGDGLAAWKEEIEGMTMQEKRDRLVQLRYEEEGSYRRMMGSAERNLERVREIRQSAVARRAGVKGPGGIGWGNVEVDAGEEGEGEDKAQEIGKRDGGQAKQPGLAELQRRLEGDMMKPGT